MHSPIKTTPVNRPQILTYLALGTAAALALIAAPEQAAAATEPWQGAWTSEAFAGGIIREAYCDIQGLVEGSLGGLLAAVAAILAVASAAMGNMKQGMVFVVTAVGAFAISAGVSLGFGKMCDGGAPAGGGAANRTMKYEASFEPGTTAPAQVSAFSTSDVTQWTNRLFDKSSTGAAAEQAGTEQNVYPTPDDEEGGETYDEF